MPGVEVKDDHNHDQELEMDGRPDRKGGGGEGGCSGICIVVMGVSGTGKSTLGIALAKRLGLSASYIEGDELHPRENVEKMSRGVPLTDEDRGPWLEVIREMAVRRCLGFGGGEGGCGSDDADTLGGKRGVVVTCSALKKSYRDILRGRRPSSTTTCVRLGEEENPPPPATTMQTYFVWINGSKEVLQDRIGKRQGHFFKATMLDSQLKTLESPEGEEGVVVVPLEVDTDEQVRIAVDGLRKLNIL